MLILNSYALLSNTEMLREERVCVESVCVKWRERVCVESVCEVERESVCGICV